MAKKNAAAKLDNTTTVAAPETTKPETVVRGGKARRSHKAADLAPTEPGPAEPTVELDAQEASIVAEYGADALAAHDAHDAEEQAPESHPIVAPEQVEAEEAAATAKPAPTGDAKYAWLARVNAQRALDHAIAQLSKHDFTQWPEVGVHGVSGAIAVLKNASASMEKLNKKSKPGAKPADGFPVGSFVVMKKAHASHYAGTLEPGDKLKVIGGSNKNFVRVEMPDGDKATFTAKHFEAAT